MLYIYIYVYNRIMDSMDQWIGLVKEKNFTGNHGVTLTTYKFPMVSFNCVLYHPASFQTASIKSWFSSIFACLAQQIMSLCTKPMDCTWSHQNSVEVHLPSTKKMKIGDPPEIRFTIVYLSHIITLFFVGGIPHVETKPCWTHLPTQSALF